MSADAETRLHVPGPEGLGELQQAMLTIWQLLPGEQQVGLALSFLDHMAGEDWEKQVHDELSQRRATEGEQQAPSFPIIGIQRRDLERVHFNQEEIAAFNDEELRQIARKVRGYYLGGEFWADLEFAALQVLRNKQGKA
ncbi:MAG: hypothetical protein GY792_29525 [Gammaproteobacteria bacterium]|nr:hypothetical protein [Gammaproteobacteria bacterium]